MTFALPPCATSLAESFPVLYKLERKEPVLDRSGPTVLSDFADLLDFTDFADLADLADLEDLLDL